MSCEPPDPGTMRCPACKASQAWSDACRRCKCDLSLPRQAAQAYWNARRDCLSHLRDGQGPAALRAAKTCEFLAPCDEARRLVAVSALLARDWASVRDAVASVLDVDRARNGQPRLEG